MPDKNNNTSQEVAVSYGIHTPYKDLPMQNITNKVTKAPPLQWFTVCGSPLTNPHYREPQDGEYVLVYAGAGAPPAVARYDGRLDLFLSPVSGEAFFGVHTYLLLPAPEVATMPAHAHTYLPT